MKIVEIKQIANGWVVTVKDYETEKAYAVLGDKLIPDVWCFNKKEDLMHFINYATGPKPASEEPKTCHIHNCGLFHFGNIQFCPKCQEMAGQTNCSTGTKPE